MKLTIELPFLPPKELSPNFRGHWGQIYSAKAWVKKDTAFAALHAAGEAGLNIAPTASAVFETIMLRITFVFKDRRKRDYDNYVARSKAIIDGLVAGGVVVDDSSDRLRLLPPEFVVDSEKGPMTILEIFGEEKADA